MEITTISQVLTTLCNAILTFLIYQQSKSMKKQSELISKQLESMKEQSELIKTQIREDHEFNRRNTTINLLSAWLRNFDRNSIIARQLLSELKEDDIKKIFRMEPLKIQKPDYENSYEKIKALINALSLKGVEEEINSEEDRTIKLNSEESAKIRFLMMDYLNTLEIVLAGQTLEIADELLKKEFEYLVDNNGCILEKILKVFDPQKIGFPIIRQFCRELKNERIKKESESIPKKEPTGQV